MPTLGFSAFGKKINIATEPLPSFSLKPFGYSKNYTAGLLSQSQLSNTKYIVHGSDTEFGKAIYTTGCGIYQNKYNRVWNFNELTLDHSCLLRYSSSSLNNLSYILPVFTE